MQETIPYKSRLSIFLINQSTPNLNKNISSSTNPNYNSITRVKVKELVTENVVIVFSRKGCCMSHVVKCLLHIHRVNLPVYEVDEQDEDVVIKKLGQLPASYVDGEMVKEKAVGADRILFPAVFIGGRFFGGLDRIMATHITGELTPVLKEAGAL